MAVNQSTGLASANVGIVFDSQGVAVAPQRPYTLLDAWERSFTRGWSSLEELNVSLKSATPAVGLPDGAPDPNTVYAEGGLIYRYVVDPDVKVESFVARNEDGDERVRERLQFRRQYVALTLEGARDATDKRKEGEPETDFWCGFCWIRGGYSPEKWAPSEVQATALRSHGPVLVFDQDASPTDAARIRHEVANMDRHAPTLPIEAAGAQRRRGRPPKAAPDTTAAGAEPPAED